MDAMSTNSKNVFKQKKFQLGLNFWLDFNKNLIFLHFFLHLNKFKDKSVGKLTWEMATKSSVSIANSPICLTAKWNAPTEMHAICFGLTFIFVKNLSTKLVALKRTSFGKSYQTLRHRKTCAAPSRVPIVISPSYYEWKINKINHFANW